MAAEKPPNIFKGMSSLREAERKKEQPKVANPALQAYLAKYGDASANASAEPKKRKKKTKTAAGLAAGAITIIDEDMSGFKPPRKPPTDFQGGEEGEEAEDDFKPVIANEEEAKALARQLQKAKNFFAPSQDGSGWQPASDSNGRKAARHDSPDASPPRRQAARHDSPDASPPRRQAARHDSPDASPPRRQAARHDSPDASPPRKPVPVSEASRKRTHANVDASPPRRSAAHAGSKRHGSAMADGTATGLVSAAELQKETARLRAEQEDRRRAAEGGGAETVYRDRATGRVVSREEAAASRQALGRDGKPLPRAKTAEEVAAEQHLEWRGGLAQQQAARERAAAMVAEAARPFARYADDAERDALLRSRQHFGDPFAQRGSKAGAGGEEPAALTARYDQAKLHKSGFAIPQGVPAHSWLKRGVAAPGNRYGIRPGRHWDGVDRSNGFEREMFKHQALRRAQEHEARMWSQEDM